MTYKCQHFTQQHMMLLCDSVHQRQDKNKPLPFFLDK